jgi:hypothetical protein
MDGCRITTLSLATAPRHWGGEEVFDYASLVVVPELTVSLIMHDMGVDDKVARKILRECAAIGGILNSIA